MKQKLEKQTSSGWQNYLSIIIICAIFALLSYLVGPNRYFQRIILLVVLWAAITSGFNIIGGYTGQIAFGYMMFVGTGAYTTVLLFTFLKITPWIGMWVGAILAGIFAFLIGLPTLRLHGAYFAVATVAFPLITFPILNHLWLEEVTIPLVGYGPAFMQFSNLQYYVLTAIFCLMVFLITTRWIERSRFGLSLKAIKLNQTAAERLGIDTFNCKLLAFIISAMMGSIAGSIYSFSCLLVLTTHAVFGLFIIVRVLSINIVGGLGTLYGPTIGAAILVPIGELLNAQFGHRAPGFQDVVYGAALIAAIIFMPEGIWVRMWRKVGSHRYFSD